MKNKRFFILIFFILALNCFLRPMELFSEKEDKYTRFCNFTTRDGLSSNVVLCILQDQYGAIWLGTDNGLSYFDGSQFTTFRNNSKNRFSLSCNFITALVEDNKGNIWVGTRDGLNIFNRKKNRFNSYRFAESNKQNLSQNHIKSMYSDKNENVWIENALGYLYQINIKTNKTFHVQHSYSNYEGNYYYHHIFQDSGNNLWIGGRGIFLVEVLKSDIRHVVDGKRMIIYNGAAMDGSCLTETLDGTVLCGTSHGIISFFNREKEQFELKFSIPIDPYAAITDNEGKIWFGGNGGLVRVDLNSKHTQVFKTNHLNPNSILSDKVLSLYKDKAGNVWVGTDNGVSLYSKRANVFRHYSSNSETKNSLSSNRITSLLQDKTGTLWIGTEENGVDTFNLATENFYNIQYNLLQPNLDKTTFEREKDILRNYYKHGLISYNHQFPDPFSDYTTFRKTSTLKFSTRNENNVSALYQDKKGIIYVGLWSHVGFNTYDKKSHTWKRHALFGMSAPNTYYLLMGTPWGSNWYSDFLEDSKGNLWCATWEGLGLNLFDRTKVAFSNKHFVPMYQPKLPCASFWFDTKEERLYLCGQSYFGYYDFKKKAYHRYGSKLPKDYPFRNIFEAYYQYCKTEMVNLPVNTCYFGMLADNNGNLWLKTNHGLIKYNLRNSKFETIDRDVKEGYANGNWVNDLALSKDKKFLWLASINGIEKMNIATNARMPFNVPTLSKQLISQITALCEDSKYRLWIGSHERVFIVNSKNGSAGEISFQKFTFGKTPIAITKITESKDGVIWIGTKNGLFLLRPKTESSFEVQYYGEKKGFSGTVLSIYFDQQDKNWICTSNGLYQLDTKSHRIKTLKSNPNKPYQLINDYILDVSEVTNGNLWISTGNGICMLERKSGRFIDLSERGDDCLSSRLTSKLLEDKDGNLWIGTTEDGVNVLHLQNEKITHFTFHDWDKSGLSDKNVQCFLLDKQKRVWIGTEDGLNLYRSDSKTFEHFNTTTGLAGNNIKSLQEDREGKIWVATNNGLSNFDPQTKSTHTFYDYHGLQDDPFSGASCKLNDGRMAFGGNYGFNIFRPEDTKCFERVDPVLFNEFEVRDSLRFFDLNPYSSINLNYSDNFFSIDFSAANFDCREGIRYRYKLNGFDKNWVYCTKTSHIAKYTNVPYGNYQFVVEVSNPLGEWKGVERTIDIQILTPWYLQIWFILLLIILSISAIVTIIRYRERTLRNAKLRLEKTVVERTAELRVANRELAQSEEELKKMVTAKDKFFSIISHDLRNPFKALNMVSRSLYEQYSELSETEKLNAIRAINDTAGKAGKLLENLLLWSLAQKIDIPYRPSKIDLIDLVNSCVDLFSLTAQKKGIELLNRIADPYFIEADPNMMTTILGNLIGNAIKFSYPGNKVIISAKSNDNFIEISVSDTGTGMSMEDQQRLFRLDTKIKQNGTLNEQGTGLGLILCREFIEKQGGKIWVETQPGKGSTFIVTVIQATDHEAN